MTIPGLDCSNPISGAAVAAAGYRFVARYLSAIPGPKVLKAAEAADLHAHGVSVVLCYEDRADDYTRDGAVNAATAVVQARALRVPRGTAIYMTVDDPNPIANLAASHFAAAAPVLRSAGYRVGFYGQPQLGVELVADGVVDLVWGVDTWRGGAAGCELTQNPNRGYVTVGGVQCDHDTALVADIGQWAPEGDDVDAYGSDATTDPQEKVADYRRTKLREWWRAEHPGTEISVATQYVGMLTWAAKGGDLTLAAIIDGTLV